MTVLNTEQLAKAAYNFLAGYGMSSHYHTISRAIYRLHLGIDTWQLLKEEHDRLAKRVYDAMVRRPNLFERTDMPGVFWLRGKREGKVYPELE